jgi:sulfide dehydrogenase cytochrome subunit
MLAATAAQAQQPRAADLDVRSLAANCAACHGTDGRPAPDSSVPGLAGMPREQLAAQMRGFKTGSRPGTVMNQLAKGFSESQIDQMAGYFAGMKR